MKVYLLAHVYKLFLVVFKQVPEAQHLVEVLDHKLKALTISNKKWKASELSTATELYHELMDFAKHHLSNIYNLCQNIGARPPSN